MLLIIDNYDSFTYNLYQYFCELGATVKVVRNDAIDIAGIEALAPSHLVISPGPCTPNEAGISLAAIRHFAGKLPMLGVCLGHQAIAQALGGMVVRGEWGVSILQWYQKIFAFDFDKVGCVGALGCIYVLMQALIMYSI